jgi:coenzyme PQQ precursor peptide PqqA
MGPEASVPEQEETMMETWSKPQVTEQEVGLEVTSYVAAEIKA